MPKMKTKRGARKRLKRTASGKMMRAGGWKQHKLEGKSPKRRRRLRKAQMIDHADAARLKGLDPYLQAAGRAAGRRGAGAPAGRDEPINAGAERAAGTGAGASEDAPAAQEDPQ